MYRVDAVLLGAVDRRDRRMIDRGEHAGLALETGDPRRVAGELLGKHLDRDFAPELEVARAEDLAHASGSERAENLVAAETGPGLQAH